MPQLALLMATEPDALLLLLLSHHEALLHSP
jgi:hypothetical protein